MRWAWARRVSGADMAPELVTVGGLTVDNVISADGTVALAQAGGNGAYSAVGALMWRPRVGLVSCAVDSYPRATLDRLREGGVDLGGVIWSGERLSACNWFIYDDEGRRDERLTSPPEALAEAGFPTDRLTPDEVLRWRDALARRPRGAEIDYSEFRNLHPLTPAQVPEAWRTARGVHLAPTLPGVMLAMMDLFGPGGACLAVDPGGHLSCLPLDEIAPILGRADAFLPSEVELREMVPAANLGDALAVIAARCPGAVAVKVGAKGALVWDRAAAAPLAVPALPVRALDPTGAGDSFCGGFLAGLVETGDPVAAARFGAISAARTVACFGADGALPADRAAARAALAPEAAPCP